MPYDINEHRHRLAVWAAARATSRGIGGLTVVRAGLWVEELGLRRFVEDWRALPDPNDFDQEHRSWRERLICLEKPRELCHGGAAKFINCYLKVGVVIAHAEAGNPEADRQAKVGAIHPPVDRILRNSIAAMPNGGLAIYPAGKAWNQLDCTMYEQAIRMIRTCLASLDPPTSELWRIEELWDPAAVS